jgi:hypothetical protein
MAMVSFKLLSRHLPHDNEEDHEIPVMTKVIRSATRTLFPRVTKEEFQPFEREVPDYHRLSALCNADGYNKAWCLSDVTAVLRLGVSIYCASVISKVFHPPVPKFFSQCSLRN